MGRSCFVYWREDRDVGTLEYINNTPVHVSNHKNPYSLSSKRVQNSVKLK